ncbi:MAG: hypothetical protein ACOYEG_12825 [Petrimonas sp.]|jgi:hypothetical protein
MEYRINGFEQQKNFYSWVFNNQEKGITAQHISLYNFLINQNNRNNWVEWFKCPFDLAMAGSGIGNKKTYYKCLEDLQEWGLIHYQKGANKWKAPLIKVEVLNRTATDTATVPQSEPLQVPQPIPLPTHIYKLITDNLKLITENVSAFENFIFELQNKPLTIYSDADEKEFARFNEWIDDEIPHLRKKGEQIDIKQYFKLKTVEGFSSDELKDYLRSLAEWKNSNKTVYNTIIKWRNKNLKNGK